MLLFKNNFHIFTNNFNLLGFQGISFQRIPGIQSFNFSVQDGIFFKEKPPNVIFSLY